MARKAKAKRVGRPSLSKAARREVRSVRLPGALWERVEARGELTATIERALTAWLDDDRSDGQQAEDDDLRARAMRIRQDRMA